MRVVSLVPSLTQTLFDLGLTTDEVVGHTVVYTSERQGRASHDSWWY